MNIFSPDKNITSYKKPVIKIIVITIVFLTIFLLNKYWNFEVSLARILAYVVCVLIVVPSVLSVYISLIEIVFVYDKHHSEKRKNKKPAEVPIDILLKLLEENEILIIEVLLNERIIEVGSSSECQPNSSFLYDKQYYIGATHYYSLETFKKDFLRMINHRNVTVLSIDNLAPSYYFKTN